MRNIASVEELVRLRLPIELEKQLKLLSQLLYEVTTEALYVLEHAKVGTGKQYDDFSEVSEVSFLWHDADPSALWVTRHWIVTANGAHVCNSSYESLRNWRPDRHKLQMFITATNKITGAYAWGHSDRDVFLSDPMIDCMRVCRSEAISPESADQLPPAVIDISAPPQSLRARFAAILRWFNHDKPC